MVWKVFIAVEFAILLALVAWYVYSWIDVRKSVMRFQRMENDIKQIQLNLIAKTGKIIGIEARLEDFIKECGHGTQRNH